MAENDKVDVPDSTAAERRLRLMGQLLGLKIQELTLKGKIQAVKDQLQPDEIHAVCYMFQLEGVLTEMGKDGIVVDPAVTARIRQQLQEEAEDKDEG
jgi:hypothetical protein